MFQAVLAAVHITMRHGARPPGRVFPRDPGPWECERVLLYRFSAETKPGAALRLHFDVKNVRPGTCPDGVLLDAGAAEALALGARLRGLYPELSRAWGRSTVNERTRLTLLCAAGAEQEAHVAEFEQDALRTPGKCRWIRGYQDRARAAAGFRQAELEALWDRTGWQEPWDGFWDDFVARRAGGVPLPPGVAEEDVEMARQGNTLMWAAQLCGMQRSDPGLWAAAMKIQVGAYLPELAGLLRGTRGSLVAAHDVTLGPLASLLAGPDGWACDQPPTASFIALEATQEGVRARVCFSADEECAPVRLAACGAERCSLDALEAYLRPFYTTLAERDAACDRPFPEV